MTVTFGFFNSVSSDRVYDATDFGELFDGVIEEGVFASIGNGLLVAQNTGMNVQVGIGRAWFDKTWTYNDAALVLAISAAHGSLNRVDVVYIEVNETTRTNSFAVLTGTPATTPTAPTLTNTSTVHQYPLAHVYVAAAVTSISNADITNKIGIDPATPWVTGPLGGLSAAALVAQWEADWDAWFLGIQGQLSGAAETALQNQINAIVGDMNPPLLDLIDLYSHDHDDFGDPIVPASLGAQMPYFVHRHGAQEGAWNAAGQAVKTISGPVKMVVGSADWTGASSPNGTIQINFGSAIFSNTPIVLIQSLASTYFGSPAVVGNSSFEIQWSSSVARTSAYFHWIAIGPE